MAQLMPLPLTVSCSSKIQIGFTFLVPAYPGCPGKEAVKWLYVTEISGTARIPLCSDRSIDISCAPGPQQQTRCSDSEVATLWSYINTFITIIIISGFAAVGPCWDRKTDRRTRHHTVT